MKDTRRQSWEQKKADLANLGRANVNWDDPRIRRLSPKQQEFWLCLRGQVRSQLIHETPWKTNAAKALIMKAFDLVDPAVVMERKIKDVGMLYLSAGGEAGNLMKQAMEMK